MPLRLFIAIEFDPAGKRAVGKLIERLGRGSNRDASRLETSRPPGKIRWCGPDQMHLTLAFLGATLEQWAPNVTAAMERSAGTVGPFEFALAGLGGFPDLRRPRVLWVGVDEPTGSLLRLQAALAGELRAIGVSLEEREFHPHVTVGRVKQLDRRADYQALFAPRRDFSAPPQRAEQLLLIRSDTRPDGPVYTTLASAGLGK